MEKRYRDQNPFSADDDFEDFEPLLYEPEYVPSPEPSPSLAASSGRAGEDEQDDELAAIATPNISLSAWMSGSADVGAGSDTSSPAMSLAAFSAMSASPSAPEHGANRGAVLPIGKGVKKLFSKLRIGKE